MRLYRSAYAIPRDALQRDGWVAVDRTGERLDLVATP
jgi:hypothetical protein